MHVRWGDQSFDGSYELLLPIEYVEAIGAGEEPSLYAFQVAVRIPGEVGGPDEVDGPFTCGLTMSLFRENQPFSTEALSRPDARGRASVFVGCARPDEAKRFSVYYGFHEERGELFIDAVDRNVKTGEIRVIGHGRSESGGFDEIPDEATRTMFPAPDTALHKLPLEITFDISAPIGRVAMPPSEPWN